MESTRANLETLALECASPAECVEAAVAREWVPFATPCGVRTFWRWDRGLAVGEAPCSADDFVLWASLGYETIFTIESLAREAYARRYGRESRGMMWRLPRALSRSSGPRAWQDTSESPEVVLASLDVDVRDVEGTAVLTCPARLTTGFDALDTLYGGYVPRLATTVLYGAPGVGKTSLLASMVARMASMGRRCVFAASEMSALEIADMFERINTVGPVRLVAAQRATIVSDAVREASLIDAEVLVIDGAGSSRDGTPRDAVNEAIAAATEDERATFISASINNRPRNDADTRGVLSMTTDVGLVVRRKDDDLTVRALKNRYSEADGTATFALDRTNNAVAET